MEYIELAITYWPFVTVASALAALGLVFDRVFTREAAYVFGAHGEKLSKRRFWYMMRETMPLHPIAIGFLIGCAMAMGNASPGSIAPTKPMIILYFTGAGVAALVLWVYAKAKLKGASLPGESLRPPSDQGEVDA